MKTLKIGRVGTHEATEKSQFKKHRSFVASSDDMSTSAFAGAEGDA